MDKKRKLMGKAVSMKMVSEKEKKKERERERERVWGGCIYI